LVSQDRDRRHVHRPTTELQLLVERLLELAQRVSGDPALGAAGEEEVGLVVGHEDPYQTILDHRIKIYVERLHQLRRQRRWHRGDRLRRCGGIRLLRAGFFRAHHGWLISTTAKEDQESNPQ